MRWGGHVSGVMVSISRRSIPEDQVRRVAVGLDRKVSGLQTVELGIDECVAGVKDERTGGRLCRRGQVAGRAAIDPQDVLLGVRVVEDVRTTAAAKLSEVTARDGQV